MHRIKNPTIEYMSETLFKRFVTFDVDKVVLKDSCPKELAIAFYMMEPPNIRVVYEMSDPICECGHKLNKHSLIGWNMDKKYPIFKYRYICSECGKTIITPLKSIVDKNCCYTVDTKDLVVNLYSNEHISYANATKFINGTYGLNISRQTTYLYNYNKTDEYLSQKEEIIQKKLEEDNIKSTGYIGHDEAFFRINGEKYSLFAMVDSNNQCIINDEIVPEKGYRDLLEPFIMYSLKDLSVYSDPNTPNPISPLSLPDLVKNTLIGDGLKEYPNIAKKANIDFHPCIFHIIMNQRKPAWKKQRGLNKKIRSNEKKIKNNERKIDQYYRKYRGQCKKIGNTDPKRRKEKDKVTEMEKENKRSRSKNKELQKKYDEYTDYNRRISEIFDRDKVKNAKMRFNIFNNQINSLPEEIAKPIRKFGKNLDNLLSHIENENIPKTNNWLELFFKIIFPKKYRNRFKTIKGVKLFLRMGKIKWYENVVFKEEIKIEKEDIWTHFSDVASSHYQELIAEENSSVMM